MVTKIEVKRQYDLNKIPKDFIGIVRITNNVEQIKIRKNYKFPVVVKDGNVKLLNDAVVVAGGSSTVEACDESIVFLTENSTGLIADNAAAFLSGNAYALFTDNSFGFMRDEAKAIATHKSTIFYFGEYAPELRDNAIKRDIRGYINEEE